ncbi:MAG: hypothetical protein ACKO0M_18620 [Cyanobium sp.]
MIYTITNIPHLVADIVVPDSRSDQVFLMVVLLVIGLLINREAWLWWRAEPAPSRSMPRPPRPNRDGGASDPLQDQRR